MTDKSELIAYRGNLDSDDNLDYSHLTTFRYWENQEDLVDMYYDKFTKFWDGEKFEYIQNY